MSIENIPSENPDGRITALSVIACCESSARRSGSGPEPVVVGAILLLRPCRRFG